jgi:hypothetical protein
MVAVLPDPAQLFRRLAYDSGSEAGGRARFQTMVTDLVSVRHPTVSEVAGPGGQDWGIDAYVGRLDDAVFVWQSKYFLEWTGATQRSQVRSSFSEVMKQAAAAGFAVDSWTLCLPCVLPPAEQQWFDNWASRMRREHNVRIDIWNGSRLRRQLMQEDAAWVRQEYFPDLQGATDAVQPLIFGSDLTGLSTALFVKQLEEAGHAETDAARGMFFAAEALARDLAARGDATGVAALEELHLEVRGLWEARFNEGRPSADESGRISGLVNQVLRDAAQCPDPQGLRLKPAHRRGVAHRLVENAQAGWVVHWREIAASHDGVLAAEIVAAQLATTTAGDGL